MKFESTRRDEVTASSQELVKKKLNAAPEVIISTAGYNSPVRGSGIPEQSGNETCTIG